MSCEINLTMTTKQREAMQERNAKFAALPLPKQRVQIAKDVIAALAADKIIATSMYLDWNTNTYVPSSSSAQLAHVLNQVECEVCGIGSLFVAAVKRADHLTVRKFHSIGFGLRSKLTTYLEKWFDRVTLDLVEDAFECNHHCSSSSAWGRLKPATRMKRIMENIIANKGEFYPPESWR